MTPITRWCLGLALYGLCWLAFPWTTLGVTVIGLAVWGLAAIADAWDDRRKDRAAFDADAIADLRAQREESDAIRRMIHGRETQTRITQTREKL